MNKNLAYMLVAVCVVLAGINIYLILDKDSKTNLPLSIHEVEPESPIQNPVIPVVDSPMQAVDLGLSVYWASCNLGAESPEAFGSFYRWGETDGTNESDDEDKDWEEYKYCDGDESCISYNLGANISTTNYDVAYKMTRGEWRMPTADEVEELLASCNSTWGRSRGTEGIWLSSTNGNQIFLPRLGKNKCVYCWTSTQNPNKNEEAYVLGGTPGQMPKIHSLDRCRPLHIRPVKDKL